MVRLGKASSRGPGTTRHRPMSDAQEIGSRAGVPGYEPLPNVPLLLSASFSQQFRSLPIVDQAVGDE